MEEDYGDFTGFFALKTKQKLAIFVWIFTCVDFYGKIKTIKFANPRAIPELLTRARFPI